MKTPRLGWLTPSFGQLVDVLAALESPVYQQSYLIDEATWIFPESTSFPFTNSSFLSGGLRISNHNSLLRVYNCLIKAGFSSLTSSISDFIPFARDFYFRDTNPTQITKNLARQSREIKSQLEYLGLELKDSKIALIYIRDHIWDQTRVKYINSSQAVENSFRNSIPSDFVLAVKELIKCGFFVIRIGRSTLPFPLSHSQFFDYATGKLQSDLLDFFFWSRANLSISTGGGANQPAFLFRTPLLLLNFSENLTVYNNMTNQDIFILPKHYFDKTGKRVTFSSLVNLGILEKSQRFVSQSLVELNITRTGNSPNELLRATQAFLDALGNNEGDWFRFQDLGIVVSNEWLKNHTRK